MFEECLRFERTARQDDGQLRWTSFVARPLHTRRDDGTWESGAGTTTTTSAKVKESYQKEENTLDKLEDVVPVQVAAKAQLELPRNGRQRVYSLRHPPAGNTSENYTHPTPVCLCYVVLCLLASFGVFFASRLLFPSSRSYILIASSLCLFHSLSRDPFAIKSRLRKSRIRMTHLL